MWKIGGHTTASFFRGNAKGGFWHMARTTHTKSGTGKKGVGGGGGGRHFFAAQGLTFARAQSKGGRGGEALFFARAVLAARHARFNSFLQAQV